MSDHVILDRIEELRRQFDAELAQAASLDTCAAVRDRWVGRERGIITGEMKRLRELPREDRPAFGQAANELRNYVERELNAALERFGARARELEIARGRVDVTRPGFPYALGVEHPIKRLQAEIEQVFISLGFRVFDLPEIEKEYYNFDALNMPRSHPARDSQDTFYFDETTLLRTHCSTVQIHAMKVMKPPVRAVSTGKVYRRDPADATHSPMFYQVDVLALD